MKSVLIIEDNAGIRENTAEIMELAGYSVSTAANGKKGVELAQKERPDIIICDIMMPELDGYGVLHLLQKNAATEHIPLIFLTAKTERADLRKGMEMGAADYVTKPFEEIELLNAVEVRLKKAAVMQQSYPLNVGGIADFLKNVNSAGFMNQLADQYNIEVYTRKQILYQEGKRPRFLYYVLKGKIKNFLIHEDGKEYITDVWSEGDFIGYAALLDNKNYDDTAIVLEDAEILQIPKDDFLGMIYGDMQVAAKFIHIITQNVKEKETRLLHLAYSSLRKRIASALIALHTRYSTGKPDSIIDISRDDIAHYVGTATESLIRTLSDFKAEKLIEIHEGKIRIPDISKLESMRY